MVTHNFQRPSPLCPVALEVVLQGGLGVVDGGIHVVNEVRRHQLLICVGENALPWMTDMATMLLDVAKS